MANTSEKYLFLGVKQVSKTQFDTYSETEKKQYIWFVREVDQSNKSSYGIYFGDRRYANETFSEPEIEALLAQKQDLLIAGDGIQISGRTISVTGGGTGNDSWRPIKVNGTVFLNSGTTTDALNITGGTNVTVSTGSDGTVIINSKNFINDSTQSTATSYSSNKIEGLFSTCISPFWFIEPVTAIFCFKGILLNDDNNAYNSAPVALSPSTPP